MNIKDLKQELHQIGIDINDSAIVSTLKEAGLTVEDVTDKSLDVVIEIFEEKYPQSTKSTSLTTQHSEIPEKPIASTRSAGGAALATATAPQTKAAIDLATPVRSLSLAQVKETIETLEIEIDAGLTADEDEAIGYLLQLYDRAQEFEIRFNQVADAIESKRLGAKTATLNRLAGFGQDTFEHSHRAVEAIKARNEARFRELDERIASHIGNVHRQPAS